MRIAIAAIIVAGFIFYVGFDIGTQRGTSLGSAGKFECKIVEVKHG